MSGAEKGSAEALSQLDKLFKEKRSFKMQSLGLAVGNTMSMYASRAELAAYAARATQVKRMWKAVVESCAGPSAPYLLDKTNSVYIIRDTSNDEVSRETSGKTAGKRSKATKFKNKSCEKELIVYVEDSIVAAELDARREMMKLKFLELFNEDLGAFRIKISRGRYKLQHPYRENEQNEKAPLEQARKPLSADKLEEIEQQVASIPNERVREALKKAMISDSEIKNAKNVVEDENPAL